MSNSIAVLICSSILLLTGCGNTTGLVSGQKLLPTGSIKPHATLDTPQSLVALRTINGPPANIAEQMQRQLNTLAEKRDVALFIDPDAQQPYTLHIYLTAYRAAERVHLTYVSDVVNAQGQRVARVKGEEVIEVVGNNATLQQASTEPTTGPWGRVTPALTLSISDDIMASVVSAVRPAN